DCPQSLTDTYDGQGYPAKAIIAPQSTSTYPAWPLSCGNQCSSYQFWVPVVSSTVKSGADYIVYPIHAIDGYDDPWAYPQVPLLVGSNTASISYSNPSTTNIQDTTAHSVATLTSGGLTGEAWF